MGPGRDCARRLSSSPTWRSPEGRTGPRVCVLAAFLRCRGLPGDSRRCFLEDRISFGAAQRVQREQSWHSMRENKMKVWHSFVFGPSLISK